MRHTEAAKWPCKVNVLCRAIYKLSHYNFTKPAYTMPKEYPNVQVSDTTGDDSSNTVGPKNTNTD